METEGDDKDLPPAAISTIDDGLGNSSYNKTIDEGPGTTCHDNATDGNHAVSVDATNPGTSSDGSCPGSTRDPGDVVDGTGDCEAGGVQETGRTPVWNPEETRHSVLERTRASWGPAVPTPGARRGQVVAGFQILSVLGRGGMGIVYKARQLGLKRLVALKMIRDDRLANVEDLARFEIEAEAVARLNHPNIVRIYEIGRASGVPFVALELLEGGTLKQRLAGTPQPVREATALMSTLARAVNAAHAAGILHRDIKPSNILFDQDGIPKIADFGLAKRLDVEEGETLTGQVIGTPSYMAPEQAKGWGREIGPAADIYALGAILYEMLTGRPPIKGVTQTETLKLVLEEDPVPPSRLRPKLPFDLETICLKCIARDPRKRYADALSMALDLDRYLASEPINARRTPLWERGLKLAQRRPVVTVLLAIGIVAAGAAAGVAQRAQAQARIEQEFERRRVDGVVHGAYQELFRAQGALAQEQWEEVRRIVSGLSTRIEQESDSRLAMVRVEARRLDDQAQRGLADQSAAEQARAQLQRFRDFRDEALFLDTTRFIGLDRGNALEATCEFAREGLGVFGVGAAGDEWALPPLPAALSPRDQDEVKGGFYELLLILADAVCQSPGAEPAKRAHQALCIVHRAAAVRSPATRAYHLRRSAYLDMKGDSDGAARERAQAERLAPADAFDYFLIGRELTKKSDWKAAITNFEFATNHQPDHFWAQCLLSICLVQVNQPSQARLGLTACLRRKPDSVWLYCLRGIAHAAEGKLARDRTDRDRDPAALRAALAAEHFKAAEGDYRQALALLGNKPGNAELHFVLLLNRGMIRLESQDLTAAAADLQEAIRLDGRRFEAFSALGQVYQRQGRTEDALGQFARAIQLRPNWAPLHRGRADVLIGLKNRSAEQLDAALRDLEDAIRFESPGKHEIAVDRTKQAALLHQAGRHDRALEACDAALEIAPRYARAHRRRIRVLVDLKCYDERMIRSCDVALESARSPAEIAELHEQRGMAKDALEDYAGAVTDYTLSLQLEGDNPRLLRRRGWWYLASNAFQPAADDFDKAILLAPTSADAYTGRGFARARLGQHRDAVSDADEALRLDDSSWRIAYNSARIYAQAAVAADSESRKTGPVAVRLVSRYQDRAFELVRVALKRAPAEHRSTILRETFQADPALQPIRKQMKFLESLEPDPPKPGQCSSSPD